MLIVEIGGTVGDIEGPAVPGGDRQMRKDLGRANTMYVHVMVALPGGEQGTEDEADAAQRA